MFILSKEELLEAINYIELVNEDLMPDSFNELSIDTRSLAQGAIYLALKGQRFDGHDFIESAFRSGASLLIVQEKADRKKINSAFIVVKDTMLAYEDIARKIRSKLDAKVFAITGSYAKTTTKEILKHILNKKSSCLASAGTENNNIGLPKTLAKARVEDEFAVLELGTNHFGEIAHLSSIAKPDYVVLTGISEAHTEFLGSIEGVLAEKTSVFEACPDALPIINADDELLKNFKYKKNPITFGSTKDCDYRWVLQQRTSEGILISINEEYQIVLKTHADFNAYNVCAAIAAATTVGIDIAFSVHALKDFEFPRMRFEFVERNGISVINDAYNANPYAFICALESLKNFEASRKILVLADMAELGKEKQEAHAALAKTIIELKADEVFFIGENMHYAYQAMEGSAINSSHFENFEALQDAFVNAVREGDLVFIKGSRLFALERLLSKL